MSLSLSVCLSVLSFKRITPKNSRVVFCPYKQRSFQLFTCLGLVVLCCAPPLLDKNKMSLGSSLFLLFIL